MRHFITFLLISWLIGCQKNAQEPASVELPEKDITVVEKADLEKLAIIEFVLDKKASREISGWLKYNELNEIINAIKKADLSYFKSDKTVVTSLINEFSSTIPDAIDTNDINSRVLIVKTMYNKLHEIVNLDTSTKIEQITAIQDLLQAYSNLNFQINKKFERDAQTVSKP